jgi:hypothetical protein
MAKLSDEERQALNVLARHHDGCAEAVLLSEGSTIRQLSGLVIDGHATLERKLSSIGGRETSVLWMSITDAGRKAMGSAP